MYAFGDMTCKAEVSDVTIKGQDHSKNSMLWAYIVNLCGAL